MKRASITGLLIAVVMSAQSQLKKNTQPTVQPPRVIAAVPQRQTDLRKETGKDLTISLVSVEKNSSNFAIGQAGIYSLNFDVINSGPEDIDISGIGLQTYLNTASGSSSPTGGYSLMPALPNFPPNGILHPGKKFRCAYSHSGFSPAENYGKIFVVKIDNSNTIAETNETNNTLELPVAGNLESWSTPLPDLTFQVNNISPVTGSTYLNTSLDISVVNIGSGEIPLDVVNQIIPAVHVYPVESTGTNLYNEAYPFATRVVGTQTYPGYYRVNGPLKPGDQVRIGGSVHINGLTSGAKIIFHFTIETANNTALPENNKTNNTVDYLYTVQ